MRLSTFVSGVCVNREQEVWRSCSTTGLPEVWIPLGELRDQRELLRLRIFSGALADAREESHARNVNLVMTYMCRPVPASVTVDNSNVGRSALARLGGLL